MAKRTKEELVALLEQVAEAVYKKSHLLYGNALKSKVEVSEAQETLARLIEAQTRLCNLIRDSDAVIDVLCKTASEMSAPTYHCSTELLSRISDYLVDEDGMEKFCYVTGIRASANHIVPTSILTPKMSRRSFCLAQGDDDSITEHLLYLSNFGHTVFLQCHRHPGRGKAATSPSSIDIANHKLWEACYPTIRLIMIEDGHMRFFSAGKRFRIEIHGKGVTKVDRTIYKFDN